MKPFYERNEHVLSSEHNICFEELLDMNEQEFEEWVKNLRKTMIESWDTYGCPARSGRTEAQIIDTFNKLSAHPVHEFTHSDELTDVDDDVVINSARAGTEVDQWFSNMMQTRINYTQKDDGYSVYDMLKEDKYLPRMLKGSRRHFRKDSFYHYSATIKKNDKKSGLISCKNGLEWVTEFYSNPKIFEDYDFWLSEQETKEGKSTGYYQVEQSDQLCLSADDIVGLTKMKGSPIKLHDRAISNIDINDLKDDCVYLIRFFKKGQKIFPKGFTAFKIGYIQVAVNFPPMTAKYLYERYTEHCKEQKRVVVYDPSCGWGGRILGAMSVRDDRHIHYVGTDPNPDNIIPSSGTRPSISKYEHLANFFNTKTYRGNPFFSSTNTYHVFQEGSEEVGKHPDFQQYRGELDFIFTSPPYFNREAYSEDENQSYKKFSSYESWREGFLRPTLETCVEYLKSDRYLLWNIADLLIGKEYLPLEKDSRDILESLGMEFKYVLQMAMALMPGQNRVGEDGIPTCKNYCKVDGTYRKTEPIFVFYKP